jgi:hypothetical protein
MALVTGVVVEMLRPIWVDGELIEKGELIEMSERDARDLKARRIAQEPQERAAKGSAKGKGA